MGNVYNAVYNIVKNVENSNLKSARIWWEGESRSDLIEFEEIKARI